MSLLKNIFKLGFIKNVLSPKLVTVTFQGKDQPALLYMPYGMFFKPSEKTKKWIKNGGFENLNLNNGIAILI